MGDVRKDSYIVEYLSGWDGWQPYQSYKTLKEAQEALDKLAGSNVMSTEYRLIQEMKVYVITRGPYVLGVYRDFKEAERVRKDCQHLVDLSGGWGFEHTVRVAEVELR